MEGRRLFNEIYLDAYNRNELWEVIERTNPADPANGQPDGTTSVLSRLHLVEEGEDGERLGDRVAVVHRYVRPDGTGTLPDPKALVVEGDLVRIRPG